MPRLDRLTRLAPPSLAVGLLALAVSEIADGHWPGSTPVALAWAAATAAPVAFVVRRTVAAWLTFAITTTSLIAVTGEPQSGALFFETVTLMIGVGAAVRSWRLLGLLVLSMVGLSAVISFGDVTKPTTAQALGELGPTVGLFAVFLGLGRLIGWRLRSAGTARQDAADARVELDATVARAVSDERARIARDLHDVVAHSVSLMVVQAVGGRRMLTRQPERAMATFDAIEGAGAQALEELARMVDVLAEPAPSAERPSLASIGRLVDAARGLGTKATLEVTGPVEQLPPGVEVAAYRIIQEAVTNAVKHAKGEVSVRVAVGRGAVEVDVRNPLSAHNVAVAGAGYGLMGMRERAALYGGTVAAGPQDGGWRIHARLPFEVVG